MRSVSARSFGFVALLLVTGCLGEEEVVSVLEPTDRVNVTAAANALLPGESTQLTAALTGRNGRTLDATRRPPVVWTSRDQSIATVSASGVVTALRPGNVTIEATQSSVVGTVQLRVDDPCGVVVPYTLGSNVNGQLTAFDCEISGARADLYSFSIAGGAGDFSFNLSSSVFSPLFALETTGAQGQLVAVGTAISQSISNARVFLAPGAYQITARSFSTGQTGAYTLSSSSAAGGAITNCDRPWLMRGLQVSEQITATDCRRVIQGANFFSDQFLFVLNAGQTVTFTLRSTAFDAFLFVRGLDDAVLASDDDSGGGPNGQDARVVFTAPRTDAFIVEAATFLSNAVGNYTIIMQ